ncbi:hypothetical protein [Saccharopolyspora sp. CA-218241]|uniref:hypothetical protein n=1 Tax=Saccharopolyspora sp. CA-218241 TaxID=3240027 RepID=UPI003D96BCB7
MFDKVPALPPEQPGDDRYRTPRLPVRVDLAKAFAYPVPEQRGTFPEGWAMDAVVDGELICWRRDVHRRWWGEVRFRVRRGRGSGGVWHTWWLPAPAIRPG